MPRAPENTPARWYRGGHGAWEGVRCKVRQEEAEGGNSLT